MTYMNLDKNFNVHVVCRTYHNESFVGQNCFDSLIEPVARSKPPYQDNMLEPEWLFGIPATEQSN